MAARYEFLRGSTRINDNSRNIFCCLSQVVVKSKKEDDYYLVINNSYNWRETDGKLDCKIGNTDYDLGAVDPSWKGKEVGEDGKFVYAEANGWGAVKRLTWYGEVNYGFVFMSWILPAVGFLILVGCVGTTWFESCCKGWKVGGGRTGDYAEVVQDDLLVVGAVPIPTAQSAPHPVAEVVK